MTQTLEQQFPHSHSTPSTTKPPSSTTTSSSSSKQPAAKPWIRTPLIESAPLSAAAGCRIFLKLENLQPSGSFKSRGIGNLISQSITSSPSTSSNGSSSPKHFYCSSGGNAGLAAVTAARSLHQFCTVVVPLSTKPSMIAKLHAAGATAVVQIGASWFEADTHLREVLLKNDPHGVYVHPFDHEVIWAGHQTLVSELKEQMAAALGPDPADNEPDAIVCSVGGGGLFVGISQGVREEFDGRPVILGVETKGCDSLAQSLDAGELVTLPKITSLATSLGARTVAGRCFEEARRDGFRSVVVSDAEAALGCWRFADDARVLVELACGAALALVYNGGLRRVLGEGFGRETKVVVVVCGGSNVSLGMLAEYRDMFGEEAESVLREKLGKVGGEREDVPSKYTAPA